MSLRPRTWCAQRLWLSPVNRLKRIASFSIFWRSKCRVAFTPPSLKRLRDTALLEPAIFRPQTGYYGSLIEEAAALMEFLVKNHAFNDGNKRIGFVLTDVMLRSNGSLIEVDQIEAHNVIEGALERKGFSFQMIVEWLTLIAKPNQE
jgi:death-on-curing protein